MQQEKIVITTRAEEIFQFIHEQKHMTADQIFKKTFGWDVKLQQEVDGGDSKKLVFAEYLGTQNFRIKGKAIHLSEGRVRGF